MKFVLSIFAFASLGITAFSCFSAEMEKKLTLVSNGKSDYSIVIPDKEDSRRRVEEAALALQKYLFEMSAFKLPILKESAFPVEGKGIFLGKTRKALEQALPLDKIR